MMGRVFSWDRILQETSHCKTVECWTVPQLTTDKITGNPIKNKKEETCCLYSIKKIMRFIKIKFQVLNQEICVYKET